MLDVLLTCAKFRIQLFLGLGLTVVCLDSLIHLPLQLGGGLGALRLLHCEVAQLTHGLLLIRELQ